MLTGIEYTETHNCSSRGLMGCVDTVKFTTVRSNHRYCCFQGWVRAKSIL